MCVLLVRGVLQHHWLLYVDSWLGTDMFYAICVAISQVIISETVGGRFKDLFQFCFELNPLRRIDIAFENRVLDSDTPVLTGFGYSPEASFPCGVNGRNVVTN